MAAVAVVTVAVRAGLTGTTVGAAARVSAPGATAVAVAITAVVVRITARVAVATITVADVIHATVATTVAVATTDKRTTAGNGEKTVPRLKFV